MNESTMRMGRWGGVDEVGWTMVKRAEKKAEIKAIGAEGCGGVQEWRVTKVDPLIYVVIRAKCFSDYSTVF